MSNLFSKLEFTVDDYVRAQDAKMGMTDVQNARNAPHSQSRLSSQQGSGGTPGSSCPGSSAYLSKGASRAESRPPGSSTASQGRSTPHQQPVMPEKSEEGGRGVASRTTLKELKAQERAKQQQALRQKRTSAIIPLQAACRHKLVRLCRTPGLRFEMEFIAFLHRWSLLRLTSLCKTRTWRIRYEQNPFVAHAVRFFFPDIERSR